MKETITIVPDTVPDSQLIQSDYIWYKLRSCIRTSRRSLDIWNSCQFKSPLSQFWFPGFWYHKIMRVDNIATHDWWSTTNMEGIWPVSCAEAFQEKSVRLSGSTAIVTYVQTLPSSLSSLLESRPRQACNKCKQRNEHCLLRSSNCSERFSNPKG